jgi:hypothetical protein
LASTDSHSPTKIAFDPALNEGLALADLGAVDFPPRVLGDADLIAPHASEICAGDSGLGAHKLRDGIQVE